MKFKTKFNVFDTDFIFSSIVDYLINMIKSLKK